MPHLPQVRENIEVRERRVPDAALEEAARLNAELGGRGRVLVRPSGTEPLVRVLAEAETLEKAQELSATIAALVRRELG
jgi:phosphoglucosamine mutase